MSNIVTFNTDEMSLVQEDGDKIILTEKAEESLVKWQQFKQRVEEVDKIVREKLMAVMQEKNTQRIDGDNVRVGRRLFGDKYKCIDNEKALALGLADTQTKIVLNTKGIDVYIKENGELPECIAERDRSESVVISEIK